MTLTQTYALQTGVVAPEEPADFPENFFPFPSKYITISPKSGNSGKDYAHFPLVIQMLSDILHAEGINVIQLGLANEPPLSKDIARFCGPVRQTAFAIKNSLCHISVDSMAAHLAGNYKTPLVELFGMTSPDSARPHYLGKHIFLSGGAPSYGINDNGCVNNIKPEDVANAVLEILGIPHKILIETQRIGRDLYRFGQELIPNFRPDYNRLKTGELFVRMDIVHDENILEELLRYRQEPVVVKSKKPLKISLDKVIHVIYLIEENYNKEEVLEMGKTATNKEFFYCGPKEKINEVRRDLRSPFDFPYIRLKEDIKEEVNPEFLITSQRPVISANNVFASVGHAMIGAPGIQGIKVGNLNTKQEFLENIESYYIWQQKK